MKQNIFAVAALLMAVVCLSISDAQAQDCDQCEAVACANGGCGGKVKRVAGAAVGLSAKAAGAVLGTGGSGAIYDNDGRVQPQGIWANPKTTIVNAAHDHFSPNPIYAYSTQGMRAGRIHSWNQSQQNAYSWHGGYNTWRYGEPTAVVVPPTASYQASYAWGVGQTRSTPIHHQFGRGGGSYGGNAGGYQNAPYFPSSTNQFGYYPVRSNW